MDEVSIDIRLNSNVGEEADKDTSSIKDMARASVKAQEDTKRSAELQAQYLSKLRSEYESLKKQLDKMDYPTKHKKELQHASNALLREIKSEEAALKTLDAELNKMHRGHGLIAAQVRKTKNEMATLSAAGQKNSEMYRKLERDLRELSAAQALVARTGQEMGKGDRSLKGLADAVSAFTGAATAASGAWVLLGGSQEEQAKIQSKLQSLIAITIGLQQVQNVLLESSTFRIQTVTKAKQLWAAANLKLATTLGVSTTAVKVFTATATLGLSAFITWAIAAYDKWITKQREVRAAQEQMTKGVASSASDQIAKYRLLQRQYNELGDSLQAKQKYIDQNKDAFTALGVSIDKVVDAENLFKRNEQAFVDTLYARAKASAAITLATKKYEEAIAKGEEAKKRRDNPGWFETFWDNARNTFANPQLGTKDLEELSKELAENNERYRRGEITRQEHYSRKLDLMDAKARQARRDNAAKKIEDDKEAIEREAEGYVTIAADAYAAIDKIMAKSGFKAAASGKIVDPRAKTAKRLTQLSKSIEDDILAIELAALKEGRAKKLRELEIENDKRKALIEQRRKDLEEIAKAGIDTTGEQAKLNDLKQRGEEEYLRKVAEAQAASDRIISEVEGTLNAKQATRHEQRIAAARREYNELREEAVKHAKDKRQLVDVLTRISREEQAELTRIRKEGELERLDFEEQVALRRIQISTRRYNLETEREEQLVKTELDFAKRRKTLLESMQASGADVAKELSQVTAQVQDLSKAMADIPAKKFEEMAGGLQRMLGTLSKIGGEIGDTFGRLADSIDTLISGIKEGATTLDKAGATMTGVMQVADVAIRQAKANQEFMRAWQEANESALQVARQQSIEAAAYKQGNIFGVESPYAKAIAGAKQYAKTMYALQEMSRTLSRGQVQVGHKQVISGRNLLEGAGGGAATGGVIGSIFGPVGTAIGAGIGAIVGGIFGGAKKKLMPVFESLSKQYGEIYDKDTFAINPKILQDYDKLDDTTKKIVDNWGAIQKKAEEARQQMRDNFRSLAGEMGDQLSNALKKGIADGDIYAAFDDFKAYASKVIYDISEQMIFANFFKQSFDEFQRRLEDSFKTDGDGDIRDDIRWIIDQTKGNVDNYKRAMDTMRAELERQGLQLPDADAGRKAEARGIGRMTQDSAERLEGLMTIQADRLSSLVVYAKQADDYHRDARVYFAAMMRQVTRIADNSDYLRKLESIASDLYRINQDGIYIKK